MLGRLTMAVAIIAVSIMALMDVADIAGFQPVEYVGALMAILALGLIVGAFVGRARWLILVGLLLAPLLLFASQIPYVANWSIHNHSFQPEAVEEVQHPYSLGLGTLSIDLTDLSQEQLAEIGRIEASVGVGWLNVVVPLGVGVVVNGRVGAGSIYTRVDHVYMPKPFPADRLEEIEACHEQPVPDNYWCIDLLLVPTAVDSPWHDRYPWDTQDTHLYRSGVGVDHNFDLGIPPIILELDLSVGAGDILVLQMGSERIFYTFDHMPGFDAYDPFDADDPFDPFDR